MRRGHIVAFSPRVRRHLRDEVYHSILMHLPHPFGPVARLAWVKRYAESVGEGCYIGCNVHIEGVNRLRLGNRVSIPAGIHVDARGGLTLDDDALIGFQSVILTRTHVSDQADVPVSHQGMFDGPVHIGKAAWLGTRVIVQPGVSIGEGAIVGSGAVVTRPVAPFDVVAGIPARFLRNRHDP